MRNNGFRGNGVQLVAAADPADLDARLATLVARVQAWEQATQVAIDAARRGVLETEATLRTAWGAGVPTTAPYAYGITAASAGAMAEA
jgi:hypothetical protein